MFRTCFSTKQEGIVTVPGERASSAPTPSWAQTRKQIFSQAFLTSTNVLAFLASLRARLSPVRVNFHCHRLGTCLSALSLARVPALPLLNAGVLSSLAKFAPLAITSSCYWPPLPRGRSVCFPTILHLSCLSSSLSTATLAPWNLSYFIASCRTDYSLGSCLGSQIFLFIILRHTGCCRTDVCALSYYALSCLGVVVQTSTLPLTSPFFHGFIILSVFILNLYESILSRSPSCAHRECCRIEGYTLPSHRLILWSCTSLVGFIYVLSPQWKAEASLFRTEDVTGTRNLC